MTTLVHHLDEIQSRLDALARIHHVPGAVLAVSQGGEALEFATGVINCNSGVETTTDALFQIGSNTKLLTTTLVMQLVDSGEIDLDAPVRRYVASFELAQAGAADEITIRHLLTHTSGIQGDYFEDFGRGDDAVERYVESLKNVDLIHRPGQMWSYCNSGFVLAGHVVERLTGKPFHRALKERICEPLGLRHTTVLVEEMLAGRCAVGHIVGLDDVPVVPPVVVMGAAHVPAGSRTVATAAELVKFARVQLAAGGAPDGTRLVSTESALAMEHVHFERPPSSATRSAQGLGWMIADWGDTRLIGHGGGTIGQLSFLEAVPERDLVVVLLTNSTAGGRLWESLGAWLFETLADLHMPKVPKPAAPPPDLPLVEYAGVYERLGMRFEIDVEDAELVMHIALEGPIAELQGGVEPPPLRLRPVNSQSFFIVSDGDEGLVSFLGFRRGRPSYLFAGGRVARRSRSRRLRGQRGPAARSRLQA
jgi:CubicO group peptidase (beta-lactamase class C family)